MGQCQASTEKVENHVSRYTYDGGGVLIWKEPINGASQNVVPVTLRVCFLYLSHDPTLAGHPSERCMYDRMGKTFYWAHMRNDVYTLVDECSPFA